MILYIENPKDSTRKTFRLINEFSKVAGCEINIQKSVAFLYTNNDLSERKIKKNLFTAASQRIKYIEINLAREVKDLYPENCKTLRKGIEDDTNKWKEIPYSWIGRIRIVKISMLPKATYRFVDSFRIST